MASSICVVLIQFRDKTGAGQWGSLCLSAVSENMLAKARATRESVRAERDLLVLEFFPEDEKSSALSPVGG